ncbi:MAG: geranylgeranylglycerol-phosphate geranylgeranyltransferase [Ferruginibacter sp.]|nr:geranylgeranylglycerol-phosphate geranylgeranyltransferase [Ferruginibacter sp.]
MKLFSAFFRLIRWPNLVFIALTQLLFFYCIIIPSLPESYYQQNYKLTPMLFYLLVTASVLIAAAGYIINDYFDINIDRVNKPGKMVVEKFINRRWAIILHLVITFAGLVLSGYVSLKTSLVVIAANIVCTLLLWVYSTTFKKKLLSGNIIISGLTAWTVLVLYFATNTTLTLAPGLPSAIASGMHRIYKFAALYAGFAFIISLIREVVKDIEDMEGDARYSCKTMPIVWGVPATKVFVGVWLVVLISALAIVQFYVLQIGWWLSALYVLLLVIVPLIMILQKFYQAQTTVQYHYISNMIKLVMLTGICSIILIKIYA